MSSATKNNRTTPVEEMSSEELLERARKQTKLGRLLEELRTRNNLSYRQAAHATGVSHSYIRNVEKGVDPRTEKAIYPTPEILKKFATAYGVPFETLLEAAGILGNDMTKESDEKIKKQRDKIFRQRLTQLIEDSDLPISEISRKTEIDPQQLKDIERGKAEPTVEEIYNLAALFKVTPDYLAGYVDDVKALHPDMPKLVDMMHFINTSGVQLFGRPMSRADKDKLEQALKLVFLDSSQREMHDR